MEMIPDAYSMAAAALWGLALGVFYFGGLWITVQKMAVSKNPKALMASSWLLRIGVVLPGMWLALKQGAGVFCVAFGIFVTTRFVIQKIVVRH
ncbi:MAG: ATP synthase subunit I [Desulfobacterales bacterium]|nr:ATP synthase subunit I [Desulfobacterales bacterium]MDD3950476.1 ATP synthase subunit I [Desulfobacterales bacterium]MDY0378545.1 ATP synthase subunit I [Desulfobacterales bacterium]